MSWQTFLETLGDSEQRNQALGEAIALVRALARPPTAQNRPPGKPLGEELGIFSAIPGDPQHIQFLHAFPVLQLPHDLHLASDAGFMAAFDRFHHVVVLLAGEAGHLTSITLRKPSPDSPWKVIRIGRSHVVRALRHLNSLMAEGGTLTVDDQILRTTRHLAHLPLVLLAMPDARQHFLVMEVIGPPRRQVPFLFFPVYDDPSLDLQMGHPLTLDDVLRLLDRS